MKRVALLEGIPKVADIADNDRGARILEFVRFCPACWAAGTAKYNAGPVYEDSS